MCKNYLPLACMETPTAVATGAEKSDTESER